MLAAFRQAFRDPALRSPGMIALRERLRPVTDSRWTLVLLLTLGVARVIVFLMAYPPAHGADSEDYFLYAAQFEGLEAPTVFSLIYPLYPLLIYLTHYVLGSVYVLILFQGVLSALQGALFYVGLRPYSPALGLATALLVIGDAQTGILYNFTSTEPLYMFLLSLAFCLFLRQVRRPAERRSLAGDAALGVVLALVLLMRPVGRYLIVPFGVLFLLGTRTWWRAAALVVGYGVMLALSVLFNRIVFDELALNGGGSFMLNRPLAVSGLLDADNGPASARVIELQAACPEGQKKTRCLIEQMGEWPAVRKLYADAYQEMLETRGGEFAELVFDAFTDFLKRPGLQYRGAITPSDAQCADIDAKVERDTAKYLEQDWILFGATDVTPESLSPIVRDISTAMCPPWPDNDTVRRSVDRLAGRYRSVSRPHPYLWYAAVGLAVLVIPWARRHLLGVLLAGAILANHALISAMVLNVQPRYIAVMNPYKGFLLLALLYVVGLFGLRVIDEIAARKPHPLTPSPPGREGEPRAGRDRFKGG